MKNEIFASETALKLEDHVIEYYMLLKQIIKTRDLNYPKALLRNSPEFLKEKENIKSSNRVLQIFSGLPELMDIIVNLKAESEFNKLCEERKPSENSEQNALEHQQESYETLIRKLENDLRNHMKTEFEMKLHIESLESKFEYYNQIKKENKYLHEKLKKMDDAKKENEIIILRTENKNMKDIISKKEKEFENKEREYLEQISDLSRKIMSCEEALKFQNSRILMESENDKSTYRSTASIHRRSNSYLTNNNDKSYSPSIIKNSNLPSNQNTNANNTFRILYSSNSYFNSNKMNSLKNPNADNNNNNNINNNSLRSKLIKVPSSAVLFDFNQAKQQSNNFSKTNFDSHNVTIYKNISKKIINNAEKDTKANSLNETLQIKSELMQKSNSNSSVNNESLYNSLKKPKIINKISKGVVYGQSQKK